MPYNVSVQKFEGPLDLLLHLIERAEIDIQDIFISEITSQYIEYVNGMDVVDMDLASEFLTMAARLLYIKSRSLLPKPPKEQDDEYEAEDPEMALIRQLKEYKAFKEAAAAMNEIFSDAAHTRVKLPEEFILPAQETVFKGGTPTDLFNAFERILKRIDGDETVKVDEHRVNADVYTVRNCMHDIREQLLEKDNVLFEELFGGMYVKMQVIVTFMALLEMIMRSEITVKQTAPYEPITISRNVLIENDDDLSYMDEEQAISVTE